MQALVCCLFVCMYKVLGTYGVFIPMVGSVGYTDKNYTFPRGFLFGAATASYQIEGGWNDEGKGVNIWDTLTHQHPGYVVDRSNGDIACDSYHHYKQDVSLLKDLGVNFYRFSISWSRVLPTGLVNVVNQAGIDYYNNLINELLYNGIKPLVTMYHWDLPQPLQDMGGWANPVIVHYFEDYASLLFKHFGDRVKVWLTFNEPESFRRGYGGNLYAPAVQTSGTGEYLVIRNVLLSHARVYRLYQNVFKAQQQGKIGIALNCNWCEPLTNSTEDQEACDRFLQFRLGMFAQPIFSSEGDFPEVVKERVAQKSTQEGHRRSRLPPLTQQEVEYIRGTWDFFGLNHYTTFLGTPGEDDFNPSMNRDIGVITSQDKSWPASASSWLKVVPWGFRKMLNWIAKQYNNPPLLITELGYSDKGELNDTARVSYYVSYLAEMLKAIYQEGNNVLGLTAWSLLDNFEWNHGYTEKFGLYYVDFNDAARRRFPKDSARFYAEIIRTRQIPVRFRDWVEGRTSDNSSDTPVQSIFSPSGVTSTRVG